ncbi:MAG: glycosyltransferase family 2 protein [Patescibacteria group bacterium]
MTKHVPKDIVLSVAIPTYERPGPLEKILEQLIAQKEQRFAVVISDDSASTAIEEVVKKYAKKLPHLLYHKNKKNLGFSGNVCKLYELAQTRYVWFLCDDDTVLPDAIKNILSAIERYKPVVAVFNTRWVDSFGRDSVAGVKKDIVYTDRQKLTDYQPLMRTTFLSIVVVEKRLSLDAIKEKAYTDNIFFQVTLSLLLLSDKFTYCEIASPIVRRNVGYKYGEFFKFYLVDELKAVTIVDHAFDNRKFMQWSVKHLPSAFELYLSQKIGLFKYHGRPTKTTIKLLLHFYGVYSLLFPLFVLAYYLTPSVLIALVYRMVLWRYHGITTGNRVYRENVNRAFTDNRKTGFTSYR